LIKELSPQEVSKMMIPAPEVFQIWAQGRMNQHIYQAMKEGSFDHIKVLFDCLTPTQMLNWLSSSERQALKHEGYNFYSKDYYKKENL